MGPEENATQRLNFAQAFNPIGSLTGMLVAKEFILARLDKMPDTERAALAQADPEAFHALQASDLAILRFPYVIIGIIVAVFFFIFLLSKLPRSKGEDDNSLNVGPTLKRLWGNKKYVEGVIAQAFYVGAQIMCWTFIIQYGMNELGMAKETAQTYNIIAMTIFCTSRFICTYLLKFFSPGGLLMTLAIGGGALIIGTIAIPGMVGLYCLIGVSACMSLMFPTIYGIALKGLGDDAKLGSAGLIMAIGGGSIMPPLQAAIMDADAINLGFTMLSSTRASFVLPLICFVVITIFGYRTSNVHGHTY
jgi:FHS family L-fucose permease-like MFS transporter